MHLAHLKSKSFLMEFNLRDKKCSAGSCFPDIFPPDYGVTLALPSTVLSDSATPSNLNTSNFLTDKDNIMFNPNFGMLSSRAIQSIPDMLDYLKWPKS